MAQKKTRKPLQKFKLHGEWVEFCRPNCCCCKMMADRPEDFAEKDNGESISLEEFFKKRGVDYSKPGMLIRDYRIGNEITQKQLAKKLDLTETDVIEIENNRHPVDKPLAKKLAKAFNTSYRMFIPTPTP